jgi:hypothetical protein
LNKTLAGFFVATAMFALPVGSTGPPSLLASLPFAAGMTARRKVTVMISYGSLDSCPAVWVNGTLNGFVLWNDKDGWKQNSVVELAATARTMTKAQFDAEFPDLPPFPKLSTA